MKSCDTGGYSLFLVTFHDTTNEVTNVDTDEITLTQPKHASMWRQRAKIQNSSLLSCSILCCMVKGI